MKKPNSGLPRWGLFLAGAALLSGCANSPVVGIQPKYDFARLGRVALLNFEDAPNQLGSGKIVSQALEPYLLRGGYNFVERSQVDQILQEQKFSQSGAVDPQAAATLGKILGADALILGTVTNFTFQTKQTYMETVSNTTYVPAGRHGRHYDVVSTYDQVPVTDVTPASVGYSARLVDASSGEVLWFGTTQADGKNPPQAADRASDKLAQALKAAWPNRQKGR